MSQIAFTLHQGRLPLLISMPHVGTELPESIARQMLPIARRLDDNDWHLPQLYGFAQTLGASLLLPTYPRYVIDLNRPPDDTNLYPGQDTTGLCPVDTFHKEPLYAPGHAPTPQECLARRDLYWQPYHAALAQELSRLQHQHGAVVLWEAHSIRSEVPRFFAGRLPDFNFGTAGDQSCAPGLGRRLLDIVLADGQYSAVLNGRFKGGHITRAYGRPASNIHAIQLELSQRIYMREAHPYPYLTELAEQVQPRLQRLIEEALAWLAARPA